MLHTNYPNFGTKNHNKAVTLLSCPVALSPVKLVSGSYSQMVGLFTGSSSCWAGEDSKATAPQRLITLWSLHHRAASRVAGLLRQLPRACSQRPKAEDRGSIRHFPTWSSKFCSISLTKFPMSQSLPRFKGKRYHN